MKIRAIRAHEVGLFGRPIAVEGLSGRLDVLAGPNELGKSTLLEAVRWALLRRHTTTAIKDIQPYGGGHPLVELDFEVANTAGQGLWRIRKRFSASSRQRLAELIDLSTGVALRGPDAEDRLAELIGATDRAHGRFGVLLVSQRDTHGDTIAPPDAATTSIRSAIEREIASVAGGAHLRAVRAIVQQRIDAQITPGRAQARARSPYAEALRHRDAIAAEHDRARASRAQHARRLETLADARTRRDALPPAQGPGSAAEAVALAAGSLETARRAAIAWGHARATAAEAENTRQALAKLDGALQEEADLAQAIVEIEVRRTAAEAAWSEAAATAEAAVAHRENLLAEERALAAEQRAHAEAEATARQRENLEAAEKGLTAGQALSQRILDIEAGLAANPATSDQLAMLKSRAHDIAVIEARLAAGTTHVRIAYDDGIDGAIRHGDRALADGTTLEVDADLVLDIPGIGRIHIAAGAGNTDEIAADRERLASGRSALAAALAAVGAGDLAGAEARRQAREQLEQDLADTRTRLSAQMPDGLDRLAAEVAAQRAALAARPPSTKTTQSAADVTRRLAGLAATRDAAAAAATEALARQSQTRTALDRVSAEIDTRRQRLARLTESLPMPALRTEERNRLAGAADTAQSLADARRREAAALSPQQPDEAAVAQLVTAHDRALARQKQDVATRDALSIEIARHEAALSESLDEAPDLNADALEGLLADAQRTVDTHEADIAALRLLADMLDEEEREARATFIKPVTQRLAPYLTRLFGEAELVFDDTLSVTSLARGERSEALTHLSDGTREQIAVLTRLGFGRLLAETGEPAPLILDDPLVFTDDQRLGAMFDSLRDAADVHQVIVLTCHERAFESLGGARLSLSDWQPDAPGRDVSASTAAE